MRLLSAFFFSLVITACQSADKKNGMDASDPLIIKGAKPLTFQGDNRQARFSPSAEKIIFISRSRPSHKNFQVYELQLTKGLERRMTFQDGETMNPVYLSEESIFYASTTDEIKENLEDVAKSDDFLPYELYKSDPYGNEILRLTEHSGWDGNPAPVTKVPQILFYTSLQNGQWQIRRHDITQGKEQVLYSAPEAEGKVVALQSTASGYPLFWIEMKKDKSQSRIMLKKDAKSKPEILKQEYKEYQNLTLLPEKQQVIYSVNRSEKDLFQLEIYNWENQCTQVLLQDKAPLVDPYFMNVPNSPGLLLFSRLNQNYGQIFMISMPADLGACI